MTNIEKYVKDFSSVVKLSKKEKDLLTVILTIVYKDGKIDALKEHLIK